MLSGEPSLGMILGLIALIVFGLVVVWGADK